MIWKHQQILCNLQHWPKKKLQKHDNLLNKLSDEDMVNTYKYSGNQNCSEISFRQNVNFHKSQENGTGFEYHFFPFLVLWILLGCV